MLATIFALLVATTSGFSQNLVSNGDFASGSVDPWQVIKLLKNDTGFQYRVLKEAFGVVISSPTEQFHTRMLQQAVELKEGTTYKLSFKAKAKKPTKIMTLIAKPKSKTGDVLTPRKTALLTTAWKDFVFDLPVTGLEADGKGLLRFNFGKTEGSFAIKDVQLQEVD